MGLYAAATRRDDENDDPEGTSEQVGKLDISHDHHVDEKRTPSSLSIAVSPRRTSALAWDRALVMRARRASLRAAAIGA